MNISFKQKGNLDSLTKYVQKCKKGINICSLDKYGAEGVRALANATPVDTGLTANSWNYEITNDKDRVVIRFYNTNIQNGIPIAIILQYGHATRQGGWVQGRDYINPAIQPVFDKITEFAWKEVTS